MKWSAPIAGILLLTRLGSAHAQAHEHGPGDLGTVHFRTTCSSTAQAGIDRAVALLHHMTYPQARASFEQVARMDPPCAMAQWGIAMTLFQPLWPTRPSPDDLERGWRSVRAADSLVSTPRDRLLVQAAEAFYREPGETDYWLRIRRWAGAMEKAYLAFPDDDDVVAFSALAQLAAAPPDSARAYADRAAGRLAGVLERNPAHPGALHYLVHANDVPGRERESVDRTRQYEATAPQNPHALHMPTHIYVRTGDWDAVIRGNLRAAEAALQYPAGDRGQFVWDEFPHAVEYLVYAELQEGDDDAAAEQVKRLHATAHLQPTFKTAFHLASTRARYALERHAWSEARALRVREPATLDWDRFMWPEAVTWFARGLGAAHEGGVAEARTAGERLDALAAAASSAGEDLFARTIRILALEERAWLAHVEGDPVASVSLMREAVTLEAATPKHAVTPAPTLPANELLGDLLLDQRHPAEALVAYRVSLSLHPRRFNSTLGAARAARASGDEPSARIYYRELLALASGTSRRPALQEARAFLDPP